MRLRFLFLFLILGSPYLYAQKTKIGTDTSLANKNLTFTGTRAIVSNPDYDSTGQILLSGYVSTYYAYYNDEEAIDGFHKFPTIAPKSDVFSLNIAQISAKYTSENFRGIFTFQVGDIPKSAWSQTYNAVQEANAGFKIAKKWWFDAGFFRTHIGLESIQPRENIATSLAMTTYFEPYFLSGAKLTYQLSKKLALQANVFNGFNNFVETNRNKAFGLSAVYEKSKRLVFTLNTITSDESVLGKGKQRIYNNIYAVYHSKKFDLGAEINYGVQLNSRLLAPTQPAKMYSSLLALKYKFTNKFALYTRGETFHDPDEILTGPVYSPDHTLIGIDFTGLTLGMEIKPIPNSYLRLESRGLWTKNSELIFRSNGKDTNQRIEVIAALGVWF